jgi:CO/xanthine dehydrogenase FAD-binding subunit
MKPPPFDYARPESLEEAVGLLAEHGDDAKVLAGGQSLVPMLNMRLASPAIVIDINRVSSLDTILEEKGTVRAGALVRQADFERSEIVRGRLPLVAEALPHVGHFVTRNRGTVGGSIAHADAKAELPLALACLGGSAVVRSARGERTVPAKELFVTHYTTSLEPDELLVETVWPAAAADDAFAFEEFALRTGDYALVMAGCAVRDGSVCVGVAGPFAKPRIFMAQAGAEAARELGALAGAAAEPHDSVHASAEYLRHLVGVVVERAVERAVEGSA